MPYRLVLVDRFLLIIGSGLIMSFIFIIAGAYYTTKLYYFMQMSTNTSRLSTMILKIFFYGVFIPMMILFFANEMAIPLFGSPSPDDMAAYQAGTLQLSLMEHKLNTGALYLVMMSIIGVTYALYLGMERLMGKKEDKPQQSPEQSQELPESPKHYDRYEQFRY